MAVLFIRHSSKDEAAATAELRCAAFFSQSSPIYPPLLAALCAAPVLPKPPCAVPVPPKPCAAPALPTPPCAPKISDASPPALCPPVQCPPEDRQSCGRS